MDDRSKIEILFREYRRLMYGVIYSVLKDQRDCEDILQDSFLKLMEIIEKIQDPMSLDAKYLAITIAKNKAIDLYRKRKAKPFISFMETKTDEGSSETSIENIIFNEVVANAVANLPDAYRDVIILRYFHEFSVTEIAEILNENHENIRKRIQRARKKLKEDLRDVDL